MDIFIILGITPQFFLSFCAYGILANIIIGTFTRILVNGRFNSCMQEDKEKYQNFLKARFDYIKTHNKPSKIMFQIFSFLIPTYTAWLNTIFLWNFFRDSSVYGMMLGLKKYDQYSIIQLVRYKTPSKENK